MTAILFEPSRLIVPALTDGTDLPCNRQDSSDVRLAFGPGDLPEFAIAFACLGDTVGGVKVRVLPELAWLETHLLPEDELWLLLGVPVYRSGFTPTQCLSPAELERAQRFHHPADRWSYMAAHGLLRSALSKLAACPPSSLAFASGYSGKPAIDLNCKAAGSLCGIHFNISHTRGLVAVALARHEVGVDVEKVRPVSEMRELVIELMSPRALQNFDAAPDENAQAELFMRFWTLSEAYLKATGEGLVGNSRDLDFNTVGAPKLSSESVSRIAKLQLGCAHGDRVDWLGAPDHIAQIA